MTQCSVSVADINSRAKRKYLSMLTTKQRTFIFIFHLSEDKRPKGQEREIVTTIEVTCLVNSLFSDIYRPGVAGAGI